MSLNLIDTLSLPIWSAFLITSDGTDYPNTHAVPDGAIVSRREIWFVAGDRYIYDANDGSAPLWDDDAPEPVTFAALCRVARAGMAAGVKRENVHPLVLEAMETVCPSTCEVAELAPLHPEETIVRALGVTTVYCDVEGPHETHRGDYAGKDLTWK